MRWIEAVGLHNYTSKLLDRNLSFASIVQLTEEDMKVVMFKHYYLQEQGSRIKVGRQEKTSYGN